MPQSAIARVYGLTIPTPAGTLQSAPLITPWVTEDNYLTEIELLVPAGHNGQTGIRIMKGDVQILPWGGEDWIVANDYYRVFPYGGYISTGDITVQTYNAGVYPHSFYLRASFSTYNQPVAGTATTEAAALPLGQPAVSSDPLSSDAILGPDTVAMLADGTITAADVAPVDTSAIMPLTDGP